MNLASNIKKTVFKVRVMPGRVNQYGWSVQKWFVGAVNLTNNYKYMGGFYKWRYPHSWMVYFIDNSIYKWMIWGLHIMLSGLSHLPCRVIKQIINSWFLSFFKSLQSLNHIIQVRV